MAQVSYEVLFPDVLVHAPNCPEPVVINAIRNACIEFAKGTLYLTEELDPIDVVANEPLIDIDTVAGYDVEMLVGDLFYDGKRLAKKTVSELDATYHTSWREFTSPKPNGYVMYKPDEVRLVPIPTESLAGAITGRVALTPSRTSTRVDSGLVDFGRQSIAAGALAKIHMIPDQPYTNEAKAAAYDKAFRSAIANGAADVRSSFVRAPMRVIPQRFW